MILTYVKCCLTALCLGLCVLPSYSQEWDNELWTWVAIEKKINQVIAVGLEQQIRLDYNLGQFKTSQTQISIVYDPVYFLSLEAEYRFNYLYAGRISNRIASKLSFRLERKPFEFIYRSQFQRRYEIGEIGENNWRNKLEVRYRINRQYQPYFSSELFYRIHNAENYVSQYRLTGGLRYKITSKHQMKLLYSFEEDLYYDEPLKINIFGIGYIFSLD